MIRWLVATAVLILSGCQVPSDEKFSQLHTGMTEAEVVTLLGEPSSRQVAARGRDGTVNVPACWQYGDNLSTFASGAMFKDQPASERVWAVYFDAEGRVSRWQRPSWDE